MTDKLCCVVDTYHTCRLCGVKECYDCWFGAGKMKHYPNDVWIVCPASGKKGSLIGHDAPYEIVPYVPRS